MKPEAARRLSCGVPRRGRGGAAVEGVAAFAAAPVFALVLAALGLSLTPTRAAAQVSLVPAQHPVYDWLHRQRVLGNVDRFAFETQPLSRGQITAALRQVGRHEDRLGASDRSLLRAYLQEFSPEGMRASAKDNFVKGEGPFYKRIVRIFRENKEPHLYAYADSGYAYALDAFWSEGYMSVDDGGESFTTLLNEKGVRAFASFYDHVGLHVEAGNLSALSDKRGLRYDELYNKSFSVIHEDRGNSNYFETAASVRYGVLAADIGHASLHYGVGPNQPLAFTEEASTFDWVRLTISVGPFRYTAMHASPASDTRDGIIILDGQDTVATRHAADRWLAMHRIELDPWPSLKLGFSEMVMYSGRGLDLAYLNPVNPIFFSELDNGTRDNVMWTLDGVWRPVRGVELFGSILLDDATTLSRIFLPERSTGKNPDRAFDVGATVSLARGWDLGVRYERIEPWVFTHRFQLNAYEQRGFPLGNQLGPNADQWSASVGRWLPHRGFVRGRLSRTRRGLNPLNADGTVALNVGGDLSMGLRPEATKEDRFLEGADVQEYREIGIEGAFEPLRGILLSLRYLRRDVTSGTRILDRNLLDVRVKLGF